jgi:hypothetical protein
MKLKIFSATEHSDSIPLDVVSPVEELRKFVAGQIGSDEYVQALERGDEALAEGWSVVTDDAEEPAGPTTPVAA